MLFEFSPLFMKLVAEKNGLILWDDVKHEYLAEWDIQEEPSQPVNAIGKFQQLTGRRYPGS